ncbi:MAG: glycosyltransferase [Rhodobacteraceae bacterium]|nr:glycosyltransferase [Paracoccaceae bacterium]
MTQLVRLFHRFADEHARLSLAGFPLRNRSGRTLGQITAVRMRRCRYEVEGSAPDADLTLICAATRAEIRGDRGTRSDDGDFALDLPLGRRTPILVVKVDGERHAIALPRINAARMALARTAVLPRFCVTVVRLLPDVVKWHRMQDLDARERIKRRLGFSQNAARMVLDPEFLEDTKPVAAPPQIRRPVTIVLPVFNAFDLLGTVLDRVKRHTDLPWRIVVIDDGSTDARVRPFLRDWIETVNDAVPGQAELIVHDENRGFVVAANAGLERARAFGEDVIVLNSDCLVPAAWASRLVAPLRRNRKIATVTPMSNDAELLSVPVMAAPGPLADGAVDRIDAAAQMQNPRPSLVPLPTGVGFCMAINHDFLRHEPLFDTAFGRGYGEEVDWCQKIRRRGGYHCCQSGLFVEHRGAASFGKGEKALRVLDGDRILASRYPALSREVHGFVRDDPLLTERLALACAWIGAHAAMHAPVILAHSMGGGAEAMVKARVARTIAQGEGAIVLRVGGEQRWQIEAHCPQGVTRGATGDFAMVEKMLESVPRRHVIYACGVGDPWAHELPKYLQWLRHRHADLLEFEFHDYFPISPSQTLLGSGDVYSGLPLPGTLDAAHRFRPRAKNPLALSEWQRLWGAAVASSDRITVFSEYSRDLVRKAYPRAADRIVLDPHPLTALPPLLRRPAADAPPVIGVLGHIRRHKGAALLRSLSGHLARGGQARLVVLGTVDPQFRLARGARITGNYRPGDVAHLARQHRVTCWLVPSIWPETFSFVTHEALATGLPVFGFDLGAQGEALRAAPNGHVAPFRPGEELENLLELLESEGAIHRPGAAPVRRRLPALISQA